MHGGTRKIVLIVAILVRAPKPRQMEADADSFSCLNNGKFRRLGLRPPLG